MINDIIKIKFCNYLGCGDKYSSSWSPENAVSQNKDCWHKQHVIWSNKKDPESRINVSPVSWHFLSGLIEFMFLLWILWTISRKSFLRDSCRNVTNSLLLFLPFDIGSINEYFVVVGLILFEVFFKIHSLLSRFGSTWFNLINLLACRLAEWVAFLHATVMASYARNVSCSQTSLQHQGTPSGRLYIAWMVDRLKSAFTFYPE